MTVNYPLLFTEKYVFYYKIVVYFTTLIFSLVTFFPNMAYFTETDTYQCFIRKSWVNYAFVGGPTILFIIVNLFVNVRYAQKKRYSGYVVNYHRIRSMIVTHRLYVSLWAMFHLTSMAFMFMDSPIIRQWHAVMVGFQPSAIIATVITAYIIEFKRSSKVFVNADGYKPLEDQEMVD